MINLLCQTKITESCSGIDLFFLNVLQLLMIYVGYDL